MEQKRVPLNTEEGELQVGIDLKDGNRDFYKDGLTAPSTGGDGFEPEKGTQESRRRE